MTLFGYELEEWADTDRWLSTVHPEDRERVRSVDADVAETGGFDMEYRIFHRDGGVRWVRPRARPFATHSDGRLEIQGLAMDVTEARRIDRTGGGPPALPLARRGDPGHDLPRVRESRRAPGVAVRLHEPAGRGDPRVHTRGDHGRPAVLREHAPPRRRRPGHGREHARAGDRRTVRRGSGSGRRTGGTGGSTTEPSSCGTTTAAWSSGTASPPTSP